MGLRLPDEIKDRVKAAALANRRSLNSEILVALERQYPADETKKADATA
jgi:hypothetical protein